jgi:NAD(P)-dependent dehydrogenase (short-subunit alcohol dehydrogenase family)
MQINPDARIRFFLSDLSSQSQVGSLGVQIQRYLQENTGGQLHALINNAGTIANRFTATEDGYELQFAVNHLAPFLLSHLLFPQLRTAPVSRVVTVSSNSHRGMRMCWQDVMLHRNYNTLLAYKQSKLANVLFTYEFNRRFGTSENVKALAADPGLVNTDIGLKGTYGLVRWIWQRRSRGGEDPDVIGKEVAWLAVSPEADTKESAYWKHGLPVQPSRYARREDEARRLWQLSESLCGITFGK